MKTIIILAEMALMFITGCNEPKTDPSKHEHDSSSQKAGHTEMHTKTSLTLNEGKKWKLDEPTRANINAAKQVYQQTTENSKQDYAALAVHLHDNANKMVSECKMSGKDHEMLHLWLEEYLTTLKGLKAPEAETHKAAFNKIGEQLRSFDQYFE